MLNSSWMQQQARALVERLQREVGDDLRLQAVRALELTTSRPANPEDVAELLALVQRLQDEHQVSDDQARAAMCLVALNINSFFYVD